MQKELELEVIKTQNLQRSLLPWFQSTSRALLTGWQTLIAEQRKILTLKQIDFLERMASAPLPLETLLSENRENNQCQQLVEEVLEAVETRLVESNLNEKEQEHFYCVKSQIRKRWNLDDNAPRSSIEPILMNIALEKTIANDKFTAFKSEILAYCDDGLEILAIDYEKPLQKIADNLHTILKKLFAALTEQSHLSLRSYQLSSKQSAQTLSLFSKIETIKKLPSFVAGKQLLNDLIEKYKELLEKPLDESGTAIIDFVEFEKLLHLILFSHPEWEALRHELFKIELIREAKLNPKPVNKEASEFTPGLNETKLETQEFITEEQINPGLQQVREQLARFGIYYSKDKDVTSLSSGLTLH